jgi:hypothetical protein
LNRRISVRLAIRELAGRIDPAGERADRESTREQEHDRRQIGPPGHPLGEDPAGGDGGEFVGDVVHGKLAQRRVSIGPGRLKTYPTTISHRGADLQTA